MGLHLPGWICDAILPSGAECRCFNGSAKEFLATCRHCGAPARCDSASLGHRERCSFVKTGRKELCDCDYVKATS